MTASELGASVTPATACTHWRDYAPHRHEFASASRHGTRIARAKPVCRASLRAWLGRRSHPNRNVSYGSQPGVATTSAPRLFLPRQRKAEERTRNDASVIPSAFPVHCSVHLRQPGANKRSWRRRYDVRGLPTGNAISLPAAPSRAGLQRQEALERLRQVVFAIRIRGSARGRGIAHVPIATVGRIFEVGLRRRPRIGGQVCFGVSPLVVSLEETGTVLFLVSRTGALFSAPRT
jgi:hypothetical protein